MKETGLTGKRRSTTIATTPDDGNSQRKRRLTKAMFNDIFRINNKTVIYEQYSYGQNGLADSLRTIFNDYTFHNKPMPKCCYDSNIGLTLF